MAKMGRPTVEIDDKMFENLCTIQCTLQEIASVFGCSDRTIQRWCQKTYSDDNGEPMTFEQVYEKFSGKGKMSLRRWQFRAAESGDRTMLIWLGKQYLGQKEIQDVQITNNEAQNKFAEVLEIWKNSDEVGE